MINYESRNIPGNSPEQILGIGSEVYDLRNRLLFDRAGQEGMQALADRNAEESELEAWQQDLSLEGVVLDATLREEEYEELSREMFGGRSFSELEATEQQRVELSAKLLSEFSQIEREVSGPLATALTVQKELDFELNQAFREVGELFKYQGSQQGADKVIVYNDNPQFIFPLPGDIGMQLRLTVERYDDQAQARMKILPMDGATGLPIDLLKPFSNEPTIREELRAWLEGEGAPDLDPELLIYIKQGLEYVKTHLENQLGRASDRRQ